MTDELKSQMEEIAKNAATAAFDAAAKEPEFQEGAPVADAPAENAYTDFEKQVKNAVSARTQMNFEAAKELNELNAKSFAGLKSAGLVANGVTLADLGDLVLGPEILRQVQNERNDYSDILALTNWTQTNSIYFKWLSRTADIELLNVAIGTTDDPGIDNKPIMTPAYEDKEGKLEEVAGIYPIRISTIEFSAVDILSDLTAGFYNAYDRKRAQHVVARLQQAVNATNKKFTYDVSEGVGVLAKVIASVKNNTSSTGTLVFNAGTLAELQGAAIVAQNISLQDQLNRGLLFGTPFVVVSDDLVPTINTTDTKVYQVDGTNVTINQSVFYFRPSVFLGRVKGGLSFEVRDGAAYYDGATVQSGFSRNEVVLRGSAYIGSAITNPSLVASIAAVAVS